MRKVKVLRGLPGSGKSRFARSLCEDFKPRDHVVVVSADDYFTNPTTGEYRHVLAEQGKAHAVCFHAFLTALRRGVPLVVVDNTNTQRWEISPYTLAAEAHGYTYELHAFRCTPEVAAQRNVHGVPLETIQKMFGYWEEPMPWWREESTLSGADDFAIQREALVESLLQSPGVEILGRTPEGARLLTVTAPADPVRGGSR